MTPFSIIRGILCIAIFVLPASSRAAHKHHGKPASASPVADPAPYPFETIPPIKPDAPPSASLQPFLDRHLGAILAPLGQSAFTQAELISGMEASYADAAAAGPASHAPAGQMAQAVCRALTAAMTERQNAVASLHGSVATRNSEGVQPRGGVRAQRANSSADNNFFVGSIKDNWMQRATALRQNVEALNLREHALERQAAPWTQPAATPAPSPAVAANAKAPAPANPAPSAPAPAAAAPAATPAPAAAPAPEAPDPVLGQWLMEGKSRISFEANHSISGERQGNWTYTCTTNAGRNYEIHWNPHKNWVTYFVLSADGKMLDGKTGKGAGVSAIRP